MLAIFIPQLTLYNYALWVMGPSCHLFDKAININFNTGNLPEETTVTLTTNIDTHSLHAEMLIYYTKSALKQNICFFSH